MTEEVPPVSVEEPDADQSSAGSDPGPSGTTGVPAVDEVLADVDRMDDLPLEEHLGVFERAHDSLRAALDAQPDDPNDPSDDSA